MTNWNERLQKRLSLTDLRKDEKGFTKPELLTVVAILGILIAIGIIILLGILERWRVDAAANQLAADMRLAHTNASNQLTDWRVVLVPERGDEDKGPDYYLVKLNSVYGDGSPKPTAASDTTVVPRTLPSDVKVMVQTRNASGKETAKTGAKEIPIQDSKDKNYYLSLSPSKNLSLSSSEYVPEDEPTRTLEFNSDGTASGYGGSPSGKVRVTEDEDPQRAIGYTAATSKIKVLP